MWPKLMAKFLQLLKTAHWDEIKYREKGNLKNIMFFLFMTQSKGLIFCVATFIYD